ncbi:M16 family metallopeptidase [Flavobacterium lacus]|uniref:Putative Zn-dependent peptidase n=1 Tax=Flavobacterium lacus TaxID=1353778 RepID=A0A328WW68_9FLAO|nr:pitrilysin family protein [Flavobacterium lacus]RAR48084.1 putative Zn-dependent peptidase [Flavobacterium lacus]
MKKIVIIATSLFLSLSMQAQDRPQPKPGPAPKINIGKPQTFELKNGLKVLVVENDKLPRISYNLTIDNAPYTEGAKKGVADLTSSLIGNGTKTISKDAFNEEIDFLGASINFGGNGAFASGLSKYSTRIMELMADGALNPVFTQEEFDKEKAKLIEGLKAEEKSVPSIAGRVQRVLAYGKSHPSGEYLSEETINNVTLADVSQNYATYFNPQNAYLVIVGDVKFAEVKANVEKLFGTWKKGVAPQVTYSSPKDVQYTQINFVDAPNAVQSEIAAVHITNLKMTDKDYFAALVANQILGGDFNSYLNMNLREAHGWTYGARSGLRGNKYTSNFSATTQVRNAVTDSAVVEILKEIKRIRTEKVSDETLQNVKAGYIGKFVMDIEKPTTVARYALQTKTQGLPSDFYENYIKNINAVTADDVLRVSKKYFLADNLRIVIVSKAGDVLPGLEKLNIPIFYFDKYGNKVEKPEEKKASADVTAKSVLEKYITAVGGQKAVTDVKSLFLTGSTTVPGAPAPLTYINKTDANGKLMIELTMSGMSMMKQVVNGNTGFMAQQGQKMNLEGEMLEDMKGLAHPFPEVNLLKKEGVSLKGIESQDGKDCYAIVNGKTTSYFDIATGLKVADVTATPQGSSAITYKDYRDVKGVKIPYNYIMNVGFDLDIKISEIKVNEGVSDADFQ